MNRNWVDNRVSESLSLLSRHLRTHADATSPMVEQAVSGLSRYAMSGKHLRARLVHIAAGRVEGTAREAATVFGACVDLLHGAFLIHDDFIDGDSTRRGSPTLHKDFSVKFDNNHLGSSLAILAGDLGIISSFQLLSSSQLSDSLVRSALNRLAHSSEITVRGEILDIENGNQHDPHPDSIRRANALKTSDYSFACPLHLGSLAAGRDPLPTVPIARELGAAFQAANDIAGVALDSAVNRATLASIQTVPQVADETRNHIRSAIEHIERADLPTEVAIGLTEVALWIESIVNRATA